MVELLQDLAEEAFHSIPDSWLLILAVAGHIQGPDLVFRDSGCDLTRLERRAWINRHARLGEPVTRPDRRLGAQDRRHAEPEGRVGSQDVLLGSISGAVRRQLRRAVLVGELGVGTFFGQKASGHPTTG